MILESTTLQGSYHKELGLPNQDAVRILRDDQYPCAVVCDGVSLTSTRSFSKSELASKFCAKTALAYLKDHLHGQMTSDQIQACIRACFTQTEKQLRVYLEKQDILYYDCQTTMVVMVSHKGKLYGGIAGDGGILFQLRSGQTGIMVTRLKTSSAVYPIGDPEHWHFFQTGSRTNPVIGALAATDGVFDNLVGSDHGVPAANFNEIARLFSIRQVPLKQRAQWLKREVALIPSHDDKTLVVMIDAPKDSNLL